VKRDKSDLLEELRQLKSDASAANTALIGMEAEKLRASAECSQLQEALAGAENELSDLRAEISSLTMDRNGLRLTSEDLMVSLRYVTGMLTA